MPGLLLRHSVNEDLQIMVYRRQGMGDVFKGARHKWSHNALWSVWVGGKDGHVFSPHKVTGCTDLIGERGRGVDPRPAFSKGVSWIPC